jgi:hypothetical protein
MTPMNTVATFRPLALGLVLGALAPAWAQSSPWGLGLSQQFTHDSNVLRTPDLTATADTISSTGLRLALDQPWGRDRLHANLAVDNNRFRTLDYLNNTSYSGDLGLDWTAAGLWQGELGLTSGSQLFRYDLNNATTVNERTLERTQRLFGRARVGVITAWTFEAGVDAFDRSYSSGQFASRDLQRITLDGGLRYRASPDLNLRVGYSYTDGRYPNLGAGDDFSRHGLQLSTVWQASGASTIDASATLSRESHSLQTSRSNSYWSGSARWQWQPTGKLLLSTRLARDSDSGTSEAAAITADAKLRTTLEFTSTWNVSSKLSISAQWRQVQRRLDNSFAQLPGIPLLASDRTHSASLGINWQPVRSVELGCQVAREQRSADDGGLGLTYAYHSNLFNCSGQFWWR